MGFSTVLLRWLQVVPVAFLQHHQATNSGAGQPEGQPNLFLYGAIVAVVVIVVLLLIVLIARKKRTGSKSAVNQEAGSQPKP